MKTHRFDAISLLLGIATIALGITAISARLGTMFNDRPDALIPLLVLGAGLLAVTVAAKRGLSRQDDTANEPPPM